MPCEQPTVHGVNQAIDIRMLEQPRFRAACDFLQLRAAAGQFDSVLAQWWMDLANADDEARSEMLEELAQLPREQTEGEGLPRRRHRSRRRRPTSTRESGGDVPPSGTQQ